MEVSEIRGCWGVWVSSKFDKGSQPGGYFEPPHQWWYVRRFCERTYLSLIFVTQSTEWDTFKRFLVIAEDSVQFVHFARIDSTDSHIRLVGCLYLEVMSAILPKENAQLLVKPLQILLAVPRPPRPMTPDSRKYLQLSNTRFHVRNLILRIFRAAYLFDLDQLESTTLAISIRHSREV